MDKFAEIKNLLKGEEVVRHYLGKPDKQTSTGIWYKSPFRHEKTASFCVSEKGIHDFGSSEHYDIISFIAKYFNTDNYRALKILCNDFNLSLLNEKQDNETIKKLKFKRQQEQKRRQKIELWFKEKFQNVCNELSENEKLMKIFENSCYFDTLSILYDRQVKLEIEFEEMQITKDKEKYYEIYERSHKWKKL
jgi:DNA primase